MFTFEMLQQARQRMVHCIYETPLIRIGILNAVSGCQLYVKPEGMQNTLLQNARRRQPSALPAKEALEKSVVTVSSGNHGKVTAELPKE